MGLQDTISKIPPMGWAAGGIFVVLLAFLATRGSGGNTVTTPEQPAADINDILKQLQDAADALGDKTTTPPPSTTPPATSAPRIRWGSTIPSWMWRWADPVQVKTVFDKYKVSYGTTVDLSDVKKLFAKAGIPFTGENVWKLFRKMPAPTGTAPGTVSTNSVQTSNNQVT